MFRVHAGVIDYAILAAYFAVVLGIGFAARRQVHTGLDFLSGRSLPAWITGLALSPPPRRAGDPGAGRQRRQVRGRHGALLLDRRGAGHGVPGHRDDAVLLQRQGPQRPRVPPAALQRPHPRAQLAQLRGGHRADRRLVWGLTETEDVSAEQDPAERVWWRRPAVLGAIALALTALLYLVVVF